MQLALSIQLQYLCEITPSFEWEIYVCVADYRLYKTIIMNHIVSVREDMIAAVSIVLSLMQDKQAEKLPRAVAWPAAAWKDSLSTEVWNTLWMGSEVAHTAPASEVHFFDWWDACLVCRATMGQEACSASLLLTSQISCPAGLTCEPLVLYPFIWYAFRAEQRSPDGLCLRGKIL